MSDLRAADISDELVEAVEDAVGYGNAAWDCVDPREIIAASVNAWSHASTDDEEPVSEEWLRSVGFADDYHASVLYCHATNDFRLRYTKVVCHQQDWTWSANGLGCANPKTRGDVRRLCKALGITLKEPANG